MVFILPPLSVRLSVSQLAESAERCVFDKNAFLVLSSCLLDPMFSWVDEMLEESAPDKAAGDGCISEVFEVFDLNISFGR